MRMEKAVELSASIAGKTGCWQLDELDDAHAASRRKGHVLVGDCCSEGSIWRSTLHTPRLLPKGGQNHGAKS